MTLLLLLFLSLVVMLLVFRSGSRREVNKFLSLFYGLQAAVVLWILLGDLGETSLAFFTFDNLGLMFHMVLAIVSTLVFYQSTTYLDRESLRHYKIYHISLIALCLATTGVYYANNAVVTWIFLEATTLATAGLVYHRRSVRSLEATWKYVFVSSVGITIAYLGILMLSTAVTNEQGLSYAALAEAVAGANPLYVKMAFLFVLLGYSCKTETFPLYTVGIDANYAAPTPASALISTALVNAGFVSVFRIYQVVAAAPGVFSWARGVLLLAGFVSVLIGAIYLRRTNNYKRLLTYSTVENMGIVLIGLGVGGVGVFAALFHVLVHSLLKGGMFAQIAQVGRLYGTYRINRAGDYLNLYPIGGVTVLLGTVGLLAFPPSGLFVSEVLILKELMVETHWALLTVFILLSCLIIYTLARRFSGLTLRPSDTSRANRAPISVLSTCLQLGLIGLALVLGMWQPRFLIEFLTEIIG